MRLLLLRCSAIFAAVAHTLVSGETLYEYLFESNRVPSNVGKSLEIARAEKERIGELGQQFAGAAVFLPVDSAWGNMPGAYEALATEPTGNVRYDLLLACSAAVPTVELEEVKKYLLQHAIVDTAYGSSYTFKGKDTVCEYVWTGNGYVTGECAKILNQGVPLDNAVVFFIDKVLLPEEVHSDVEHLIEFGERRRRRM